jgi:hypothetical protein
MCKIEHLKMLAETDFDGACIWAEHNIGSIREFFDTWSPHCGAPKEVFKGHVVRMLIELEVTK